MNNVCLFLIAAVTPALASAAPFERDNQMPMLERATTGKLPTSVSKNMVRSAEHVAGSCKVTITDSRQGGQLDEGVEVLAFGIDQAVVAETKWDSKSRQAVLSLLPGHYDLAIPMRQGGIKTWIIKENVDVSGNMDLSVAASEASSLITFRPIDPEGQRLEGPVFDYYETFDRVDGPVKGASGYIFMHHAIYGEFWMNLAEIGIFDFGPDGKISTMDEQCIAVTPNTRFSLHGVYVFHTPEGQYVVSMGSKGSATQTISNDPASFVTIDANIQTSPAAEVDPDMAYEFFTTVYGDESSTTGGCTLSAPGARNGRYFLSANPDNDSHANLAIIPKVDEFTEMGMWSQESYALTGSPVLMLDGVPYHKATGSRTGGYHDYFTCNSDGRYSNLAVCSDQWSFVHPESGMVMGGNCPILQVIPLISGGAGSVDFAYVGRCDEVHEHDVVIASISIDKDGSNVFKGKHTDYLKYWKTATSGKHTVTIDNSNVLVDGIAGHNLTVLTFDPKADDPTAPSVAALRFHDKDGNITDRFSNASDGKLSLAVADYTHGVAGRTYLTASAPRTVSVEYAPYGSSDFSPLQVNTDGDVFVHGYGCLYTGSLNQVTRTSANGWYDLRVSISDAAGNTCTELISPAFKADTPAGVMDIRRGCDSFGFDGSQITSDGSMELYSAGGIRVRVSYDGSIDTAGLAPGVYIVRSGDHTARIIVK